uniref:Multiple epidermal growth factor-like domains protein 6 n=1 Tax=Crassostrea virginica TaxID=6565 RepID=A0A8B8AUH9_CRAVI|nr:multiple epidermal growth factor-like domains protein 6 [Crassostrea virginica]
MRELIIFYHLLVLTNSNLCNSPDGLVCCSGFVWDKIENRCLSTVPRPCQDGYYGLKCRLRCPIPYFGEGCVLKCNCSEEHCHHVHGCKTSPASQAEVWRFKFACRVSGFETGNTEFNNTTGQHGFTEARMGWCVVLDLFGTR